MQMAEVCHSLACSGELEKKGEGKVAAGAEVVLLPPACTGAREESPGEVGVQGHAGRWRAATLERAAAEASQLLLRLRPEQRPKTRAKLTALVARRVKPARLFVFHPLDVARDLFLRGRIPERPNSEPLFEWLGDAAREEPAPACVPPDEWPECAGVVYAWRVWKMPELPAAGLARWICTAAYVVAQATTEEVVSRLLLGTHGREPLAFAARGDGRGSPEAATEAAGSWCPGIPKPLKGPLSVQAALLISLPESCPAHAAVQRVRERHDPAFPRWMPHINLIYPFLPASQFQLPAIRRRLLSGGVAPFELRLTGIGLLRHPRSSTYYLKPDEQSEKDLQALHERILAAFPALPKGSAKGKGKGKGKPGPDDGHDPDGFLPHMTVAKSELGPTPSLDEEIAAEVGQACFRVEHVSLCERSDDTPFVEVARLPLVA